MAAGEPEGYKPRRLSPGRIAGHRMAVVPAIRRILLARCFRFSKAVGVKLEILYFDGCPTYRAAEGALSEALRAEGLDAWLELVAVNTDEEASRRRFPGSPTIRADGRDLFPVPDRSAWALGCRTYATPEGLKGAPTVGMSRAALRGQTGGALRHSPEAPNS